MIFRKGGGGGGQRPFGSFTKIHPSVQSSLWAWTKHIHGWFHFLPNVFRFSICLTPILPQGQYLHRGMGGRSEWEIWQMWISSPGWNLNPSFLLLQRIYNWDRGLLLPSVRPAHSLEDKFAPFWSLTPPPPPPTPSTPIEARLSENLKCVTYIQGRCYQYCI